jgi:hypothetical protein
MTPSPNQNPLKNALDAAKPDTLADIFRTIALGDVLRDQIPQVLRKQAPAADPSQLSTLQSFGVVAKGAPAAFIARARGWRVSSAGATPEELAPQAYGATPSTGQIAVAPNGDVVVLASDNWVDVDVTYLPERGDVVVLPPLPVASGLLTLPDNVLDANGNRMVILLLGANATVATAQGQKKILVPAGTLGSPSLPSAGQARLTIDGLGVEFNTGTDAVTQAVVTLLVVSANDLDTLLEQSSSIL